MSRTILLLCALACFFACSFAVFAPTTQIRMGSAPHCVVAANCASKDWLLETSAEASDNMKVLFAIKQKNLKELEEIVMDISDPFSANYGNLLTFQQVGEMVANVEATKAVENYLQSEGIAFESSPHGEFVTAKGTVQQFEKVLMTKFHYFSSAASKSKVIRALQYHLPQFIAQHVDYVGDVSSFPITLGPRPLIQVAAPNADLVTPDFINKFYNISSNDVKNSATSQSLFESLNQYFDPDDVTTFQQQFNVPEVAVANVIGSNDANDCPVDPNTCVEANLDVEYILAMANSKNTTYWSIDPSGDIFGNWIAALSAVDYPPLVHSISYGSLEPEEEPAALKRFNDEALKLGARGVTIISSSGDDGVANFLARQDPSSCGFTPSFPATAPYVTALGATQGPESGQPEIMCSSSTGGIVTSGGGFSTVFDAADYQKDAINGYYKQNVTFPPDAQYAKGGRGYPDVSLLGYNYAVVIGGQTYQVSGTSASAPTFAGLVSLVNDARLEQGKSPLGFLNTAIYKLAAADNQDIFRDVTSGENNCCAAQSSPVCCQYGFFASAGWDPTTGFGSVNFDKMLEKLAKL